MKTRSQSNFSETIMRTLRASALLVFTALSFSLQAAPEKAAPAVESTVKTAVESWLKGRFKVESVSKTAMPGIVEVRIGADLIYADEKGLFAIVEGQMVNLKTGENLTAMRIEELNKIDFAKLPKDLAMKTVRGNGKRVLAVFEDPYCSFCRTYRKTLTDLNNVTVYTFFYPMLRAESETVARNAWCAKNREETWNDWMLLGKEPSKAGADCKFQSAKIIELGKSLGISGTPTTFLADGRRLTGAIAKDRLEQLFAEAK
ncbi:MAG: DsbC family protein [Burkholderiaceae bacterium]|nr:DsbC family protein [Burkholderiaceae bacterium]